VIDKVPVPKLATALEGLPVPPVTFPTIAAVAGDAAEKVKQLVPVVVVLLVTFDVNVTPEFNTKYPVPAFESSLQVTLEVMVTMCPLETRASSAAPGTTPPVQVDVELKLPVAAEVMRAMV
jgi:hypothetical protein